MKGLLKNVQIPRPLDESNLDIQYDSRKDDFEEFGDLNNGQDVLVNIDTKYSFNIKSIWNEEVKSTSFSSKSNKNIDSSDIEDEAKDSNMVNLK